MQILFLDRVLTIHLNFDKVILIWRSFKWQKRSYRTTEEFEDNVFFFFFLILSVNAFDHALNIPSAI